MSDKTTYGATVIYLENGVKEALDFYQKVFDFTLNYYQEDLDFGELDTGTTALMIASYNAGLYMTGPKFSDYVTAKPKNVELAFTVQDVDACFQAAIEQGAKLVKEPTTFPWGQRAAYAEAPDGTLLGILTPLNSG